MTIALGGGRVPHFELRHRLALALEHADITVSDIADELGVHRNTIGRYLAGRHVPRSVLIAWALRTNVSLAWLERGDFDDDGGGDSPVIRPATDRYLVSATPSRVHALRAA